jgi:hypothetical protein
MEREAGWYYVKLRGFPWEITHWSGKLWTLYNDMSEYEDDSEFEEVGKRIIMPDEQPGFNEMFQAAKKILWEPILQLAFCVGAMEMRDGKIKL